MSTLATYAACMTGAFLITVALLLIVGCDLRARERQVKAMRAVDHSTCVETEDGLRDQLHAESGVAAYWMRRFESLGYRAPVFETPAEHFRREAMERHTQAAVTRLGERRQR